MKTWQFWVIVAIFVLVIVPLIYFAIVAKSVRSIASSLDNNQQGFVVSGIDPSKQIN